MRAIRLIAALGLLLGSFAVATPVAAGDPCYHGFELPARSEGAEAQIKMMPCAFAPTIVRVAPGTTVEWFNDVEKHLITGANQEWGFRDAEIGAGETVAFRFDRAGTYPYACAIHRGMAGTIVVGDGIAAPATAGDAPAVVTVKPPAAAASSEPSTAPAARAPVVVPSAAAAAVVSGPVAAQASGGIPLIEIGLLALILVLILAMVGAYRVASTRAGARLRS
jgi:plastocyanin